MTEAPFSPDYPASVVGGELRLPKPPGVIRQFWARHPRFTDALIAALFFVPTFIGTLVVAFEPDAPPLWLILLRLGTVVAASATLMLRRSRPWTVLFVAWGVCLFVYPFGATDVLAILLALYALAVYRSTKAAWIGFACSVAVGTASAYLATWTSGASVPSFGPDATASTTSAAIFMLIATLVGITVGNQRRYLNALIARAHDLARERDQQAQLAAADERARIAREMHDIVSHGLTVMIALADGSAATVEARSGARLGRDANVADTGRDALGEMRRMLGVLSAAANADAVRSPQPDAAGIPDLVDEFREAGLPARFTTIGPPITEPTVQLTVYRIVQEGLTNALRHAERAQRVEVLVTHRGDVIEVVVEDDAIASSSRMDGAGRGLAGLRERVALYRGSLEAEPRPGRGWKLRAVLHTGSDRAEETA